MGTETCMLLHTEAALLVANEPVHFLMKRTLIWGIGLVVCIGFAWKLLPWVGPPNHQWILAAGIPEIITILVPCCFVLMIIFFIDKYWISKK